MFCIKDTGIGMDKEYIPRIFEPFSQEDGSTKNKYGSTGLGMAITKNIVEMMNGTISVESEKGVGSEFAVTVTLRNADSRGPGRESPVDISQMRVLVVDDEDIPSEHARMVLDEAGIRADTCKSGKEAAQGKRQQGKDQYKADQAYRVLHRSVSPSISIPGTVICCGIWFSGFVMASSIRLNAASAIRAVSWR